MNIAICLDDNYVMPAIVLIQSIGDNNKGHHIDFFLVSSRDLKYSKDVLMNAVSKFDACVYFMVFDSLNYLGLESIQYGQWSITIMLRLFLSEILPENIHKVMYLDGDIIVRHGLFELYNTDLANHAVGAVPDAGYPTDRVFVSYNPDLGYFNSGMMLINLDYDRRNNLIHQYLEFTKSNKDKLKCPDQDVLNNVLVGKIKNLDVKYNVHWAHRIKFSKNYPTVTDRKQVLDAFRDPVIVHFYDKIKPWHKYCRNIYAKEWDMYLSRTDFRGLKKSIMLQDKRTILLYYIYKIMSDLGIYKFLAFRL